MLESKKSGKKRKARVSGPGAVGKKVKRIKGDNGQTLKVKLKVPKTPEEPKEERVKEVDSDGDTIGAWSENEDGQGPHESSLTPLSDRSTPIPPRLRFPPRPMVQDNDYLASLVQSSPTAPLFPELPNNEFVPDYSSGQQPFVPIPNSVNTRQPYIPQQASSVSSSGSKSSTRRRKPPPKANIVRAPKHSITPPTLDVALPQVLNTTSPVSWPAPSQIHTPTSQSFPPTIAPNNNPFIHQTPVYPNIAQVYQNPYPANYIHYPLIQPSLNTYSQFPPPYSHSPTSLNFTQQLPQQLPEQQYLQFDAPASIPPPSPAGQGQVGRSKNLDLLSMAAAEARLNSTWDGTLRH